MAIDLVHPCTPHIPIRRARTRLPMAHHACELFSDCPLYSPRRGGHWTPMSVTRRFWPSPILRWHSWGLPATRTRTVDAMLTVSSAPSLLWQQRFAARLCPTRIGYVRLGSAMFDSDRPELGRP